MKISDVLRSKGSDVVTVRPDTSVGELLGVLADHGIGAVVVTGEQDEVVGIVSERDIVRRLHAQGRDVVDGPVSGIMTAEVQTCVAADDLTSVEATMTERRIRHLPVVHDGSLVAIVSIGDVVKHRMRDLTAERDQLEAYIHQ